jgi:hypothetical protein
MAEERAAHELAVNALHHKSAVAESAAANSSARCTALGADNELLEVRLSALLDRLASAQVCVCVCVCVCV